MKMNEYYIQFQKVTYTQGFLTLSERCDEFVIEQTGAEALNKVKEKYGEIQVNQITKL